MSVKLRLRRTFSFQRRASCPSVGVVPIRKQQVGDSQLLQRNTTGQATPVQSFATPPSYSPLSPNSSNSLTDIDETGSSGPVKFKFPPPPIAQHRRRFTISGMSVRSAKSALALSNGSLNKVSANLGSNGTANGHLGTPRIRHLSTGSSNQSDDPEMSISDITTATNFFDFDENADDHYLATPEEHIFHLRQQEKKGSLRKDSITAQPFTPLNVETIGGAYIEEEPATKGGHSRQGSKVSVLSSIPESVKSGNSSKSAPSGLVSTTRVTPPDTPNARARIAQLERELEELKIARWRTPPITDTINRILMGQSYCLEWYKSMDQKRALLDAAIDTSDGNCITTILLFIRKTLNHEILIMMVKDRPKAVSHYCSFLKQLHAWKELTLVYEKLGDYESLGYLKLRECEEIQDEDQRLKQLQACQTIFNTTPALTKNVPYIDEYINLVKKQKHIVTAETKGNLNIKIPILFTPLTTTLLYCCKQHSCAPETHVCNPEALRTKFNISEKQYFQVCLLALTLRQKWSTIETLLTTKGVLGFGKKKKSPIGFERVVRTVGNPKLIRRPPSDVLKEYLMKVEDLESRLTLATFTMVYDVGIETLKQMKDRERLRNYINQIPLRRQAEFRGKICALVDNTQIKWKTR